MYFKVLQGRAVSLMLQRRELRTRDGCAPTAQVGPLVRGETGQGSAAAKTQEICSEPLWPNGQSLQTASPEIAGSSPARGGGNFLPCNGVRLLR